MGNLQISLFKKSESSFTQLLDEEGIDYQPVMPFQRGPMNSGTLIEITKAVMDSVPFWGCITGIVVGWLKYRNSRIIEVTKKDGTRIRLEGNVDHKHIESVLKDAESLMVIDTK